MGVGLLLTSLNQAKKSRAELGRLRKTRRQERLARGLWV